jgi:hypothetical protein
MADPRLHIGPKTPSDASSAEFGMQKIEHQSLRLSNRFPRSICISAAIVSIPSQRFCSRMFSFGELWSTMRMPETRLAITSLRTTNTRHVRAGVSGKKNNLHRRGERHRCEISMALFGAQAAVSFQVRKGRLPNRNRYLGRLRCLGRDALTVFIPAPMAGTTTASRTLHTQRESEELGHTLLLMFCSVTVRTERD